MENIPSDPPAPAAPAAVPVRYDYLDALRGWAILGVFATHVVGMCRAEFPGIEYAYAGKYGVQLFFMVSAFTIFLTLDRSAVHGRPAWDEFFIRRLFRILPMFWVGLALYAFAPGRSPLCAQVSFRPVDYLLTATLQHGWHPLLLNSLVPGGWSIAVEGTFYLLTPLFYRLVRSWQAAVWLLLVTAILAVRITLAVAEMASNGDLFVGVPKDFVLEFLGAWFPRQLPVFACGLLVYHLTREAGSRPASKATGAALLGVAAMGLCSSTRIGVHGWITENVYFALTFMPLMLGLRAWPVPLLVNRATRFLGKISYSAYVLHFVVVHLTIRLLARVLPSWPTGGWEFALVFTLTIVGTVLLSSLAWRFVEQPCIQLGARWIRQRRAARTTRRELPHAAPLASGVQG